MSKNSACGPMACMSSTTALSGAGCAAARSGRRRPKRNIAAKMIPESVRFAPGVISSDPSSPIATTIVSSPAWIANACRSIGGNQAPWRRPVIRP